MKTLPEVASGPRVEFFRAEAGWIPGDDTLAALVYGGTPPTRSDPRLLHVGLATGESGTATELWRAPGPVTAGSAGPIRFAAHPDFMFGILELDELQSGGLPDAAESAYRFIREFQESQPQRHLLRIWNFLDSINEGEGDLERYRRFCVGRSRGLGDFPAARLPAATAVGRRNATGQIQVCWLAGRRPGLPVENPRQVRAYEYPRDYGPSPPSFARAMRLESGELMGSGTSSIVGHQSLHGGDLGAQIDETLRNLRELHRVGGAAGAVANVKVYLRKGAGYPGIAEKVQAGLPGAQDLLLIEADICRRELLVEIECTWV